MTEAIQNALRAGPWGAVFLVAAMAWLEYIFPPVPGDTTMLFACFLAGMGLLSLPAVLLACLSGSVAGALSAYAIGARLGRSYFFLRSRWARAELARLERGFARFGARLLVVNRFLPGLRAVFLYGAGIARLRWRLVLFYSTLSNVLWVGAIAWGATSLGGSWEEVRLVFRRYFWGIGIAVGLYVVATLARAWRARGRGSGGPISRAS